MRFAQIQQPDLDCVCPSVMILPLLLAFANTLWNSCVYRIVFNMFTQQAKKVAMIKFIILFHQPAKIETFENAYQDFLALIERMPHILRRQVVHITGSPQGTPKYYRILEIYFESVDKQQEALLSDIGQEAGKEIGRFPKGTVELLFADVYEEDGGSTPTPAESDTPEAYHLTDDEPEPDDAPISGDGDTSDDTAETEEL